MFLERLLHLWSGSQQSPASGYAKIPLTGFVSAVFPIFIKKFSVNLSLVWGLRLRAKMNWSKSVSHAAGA